MILRVLLAFLGLLFQFAHVAEHDNAVFDGHPPAVRVVAKEPALELNVTLSDKVTFGRSDNGVRHIVPITGGHLRGRDIEGEVIAGGADWQVDRRDGVRSITALHSIRTDDGQVVTVDNRCISVVAEDDRYRMTNPKFHAPIGQYDWPNRPVFVGTITSIRSPRVVIVRVYDLTLDALGYLWVTKISSARLLNRLDRRVPVSVDGDEAYCRCIVRTRSPMAWPRLISPLSGRA